MSRYSFSVATITPSAIADATNLTTSTFLALAGGTATQINKIWSVNLQGQATSSNVNIMLLAMDSTLGATVTALSSPNSNGPLNAYANVLTTTPAVGYFGYYTSAAFKQRHKAKKPFTFNAFGGSAYWHAYDYTETYDLYGLAINFGEASFSGFTGTAASGPVSAEIVYENNLESK